MTRRRGATGTGRVHGRTAAALVLGSVLLAGCSSDRAPGSASTAVAVAATPASSSAPAVVSFAGLTLSDAADLSAKPRVSAGPAAAPARLQAGTW